MLPPTTVLDVFETKFARDIFGLGETFQVLYFGNLGVGKVTIIEFLHPVIRVEFFRFEHHLEACVVALRSWIKPQHKQDMYAINILKKASYAVLPVGIFSSSSMNFESWSACSNTRGKKFKSGRVAVSSRNLRNEP